MTHNPWISDEDLDEIEELDVEENNSLQVFDQMPFSDAADTQATTKPRKVPSGTALPEYLDEEIAAELASDLPPLWFGMRWRDIPAVHQTDAWNELRRWVDWFMTEYCLTTSEVPPCWYRHTNIVAELYAAMCMEYKVWEENEPGLGPTMFWHSNLQQIIMRLKMMVSDAGCAREGSHKEPVAYGGTRAHELSYDEADWLQHVGTVRERIMLERPEQDVMYVRARIESDDHGQEAVSDPVGINMLSAPAPPELSVGHVSTHGQGIVLEVEWEHYSQHHHLCWEVSTDGQTWKAHTD